MGQVLARIVMWGVIIAMVWYFAQQWNKGAPSEQEQQKMMEAARSYQEYKAQLHEQEAGESSVPKPQQ